MLGKMVEVSDKVERGQQRVETACKHLRRPMRISTNMSPTRVRTVRVRVCNKVDKLGEVENLFLLILQTSNLEYSLSILVAHDLVQVRG